MSFKIDQKKGVSRRKPSVLADKAVINKLLDLIERNLDARLGKIEKTSEKNANLLSLVVIAAEKATQKLRNIQIMEERESKLISCTNRQAHQNSTHSLHGRLVKHGAEDEALNLQSTIRSFFQKVV